MKPCMRHCARKATEDPETEDARDAISIRLRLQRGCFIPAACGTKMPRRHTIPRVTTLIIHPKVRGFICTTTHPLGCELNVRDQIAATRAQGVRNDGPKKVLVIGASSGYGLAARISAERFTSPVDGSLRTGEASE